MRDAHAINFRWLLALRWGAIAGQIVTIAVVVRGLALPLLARLRAPAVDRRPARLRLLVLLAALALGARAARACDVCAIYTATEQRESRQGFRLGVAEQFSRFATLQDEGHKIDNPGEHLNSATTQLIGGYDFTSRFGLQLTLPIIVRDFRRREHGVITSGSESGVGDMSLLGIVRPFSYVDDERVVRTSLFGGLKFPTGSPDRLREELPAPADGVESAATRAATRAVGLAGARRARHAGHDDEEVDDGPIGVHGHDLALGSGSYDGLIGGTLFASWERFFWTTTVQYAMRTEGSFDYRYANEVTWGGGPGVFPYLAHDLSVAATALVSGEHKGLDTLRGVEADDTGITAVYMGPGLSLTWGTSLAADVAVDFPMLQHNTAVQIVPDYRIRGGVSWRF
jgi:hypothetical protein